MRVQRGKGIAEMYYALAKVMYQIAVETRYRVDLDLEICGEAT